MPENYVLLERTELNASVSSVTFSNIPQTGYTDLKLVASTRVNGGANAWSDHTYSFNGTSTSTNVSSRVLYGTGSSALSTTFTTAYFSIGEGNAGTANTFGNSELYIPNYTSSNFKSMSSDGVSENNATSSLTQMQAALWSNTAPITSITITDISSNSFVAGSTFSLYGIAALGTTPAIAPKASGGNIIDFDGTYWIHTFLTSGTFTPQVGLTCDYLVVAGGGSGAGGSGGVGSGGGGAGGYRTATGSSLIAATNYSVTIGAGAASVNTNVQGNNGSNSVFDTITSTGGGGGGAYGSPDGTAGNAGGSGGGGGTSGSGGSPAGGSASPSGQGNAGGAGGTGAVSPFRGGGGGGASAVGATASASGNGGAGTASSITGTSVTRAGGGGGGGNPTGGAGGSGGGGAGASGGGVNGTSGTANTGGGGGGATGISANSGSGGSGVVIIRYPAA
jgi:hypothetical protein